MITKLRLFVKEHMEIWATAGFTVLVGLAFVLYSKSIEPNVTNAGLTQIASLVVFLVGIALYAWAGRITWRKEHKESKESDMRIATMQKFIDINASEAGQPMIAAERNKEIEDIKKQKENKDATP